MSQELHLTNLRKRAELPNALHGCSSDPCGSVVCQTARDRDTLLTRLEQAEQAVARVREVIKGAPTVDPLRGFAGPPDDWPDDTHFTSYGEWIMANRVREALDGDGRRLADQGLDDKLARTSKNGGAS